CRRSYHRRDLGAGRRTAAPVASVPQEPRIRRLLPRPVLRVRGPCRGDSSIEGAARTAHARGVPRMEGGRLPCRDRLAGRGEVMIFRPFYYDDLGCATYLLGCGTLGKC